MIKRQYRYCQYVCTESMHKLFCVNRRYTFCLKHASYIDVQHLLDNVVQNYPINYIKIISWFYYER